MIFGGQDYVPDIAAFFKKRTFKEAASYICKVGLGSNTMHTPDIDIA